MKLTRITICNFKSIVHDDVLLADFTFFVEKNNYGKSNYLKAIESLLSFGKTYGDIKDLQNKSGEPIVIEGYFEGVKEFTPQLKDSKHKDAVEKLIDDNGLIRLRLTIKEDGQAETYLVDPATGQTVNPTGWNTNCRKLFPETIFVPATADTAEELQEKASTALSKIKKEIMQEFFTALSPKIASAFEPIDRFLHDEEARAKELAEIEKSLAEEMMGEFEQVRPSIRFTLPDLTFIGKGMKIYLDDGFHDCEIEQKGHGLQRTALFALMRLLSKHHVKEKTKPSPIFLIEDLEAFLHPSAQQRLAESIDRMSDKYQTIATTHSPFVISEKHLAGYRKLSRGGTDGSKCCGPQKRYEEFKKTDYKTLKHSLAHTGNLISLFADTVVIVEGREDSGFYSTIFDLLGLRGKSMISFVKSSGGGNATLHVSYNFFKLMGFDKVFVIADLDCLFDTNFKNLLETVGVDSTFIEQFKSEIGFLGDKQPGLSYVLGNLAKIDRTKINNKIDELSKAGVFILRQGSPENYYSVDFIKQRAERDKKTLWEFLTDRSDLANLEEIHEIMNILVAS